MQDMTLQRQQKLDLKSLREFQSKEYSLQRESKDFKPTPPGFDPQDALDRINIVSN